MERSIDLMEAYSYPVHPWTIEENAFEKNAVRKNESVFSLGNGYLGLRGCYEEGFLDEKLGVRGTYLNAFYETEKIRYGEIAHAFAEESQTMLNVTDARRLLVTVDGETFHIDSGRYTEFTRTLDMQRGLLTRSLVWQTKGSGRIRLRFTTLVSFDQPHAAAIRLELTPLDGACRATVTSVIDGDVSNLTAANDPRVGSGLQGRALSQPVFGTAEGGVVSAQHTKNTKLLVACAMAHSAPEAGETQIGQWQASVSWTLEAAVGETLRLDKFIAYEWGGMEKEAELRGAALRSAQRAKDIGFDKLAEAQIRDFSAFWQGAGIELEGDDALLQGLRFNLFHLLQSAGHDGRTNISAKGLTGEGYEGHYFWDTETYVLPMFLFVQPEKARGLLLYRYGILDAARQRAREMGHPRGALYAWRTIGGKECSAYYPAGTAQYHINADIAFAVKRYVEATEDMDFLCRYGAEMLIETARLFLDLGFYNENRGGKFCINHVTGPDEYNAVVNNNCYTNLMAAENLRYAAQVLEWLRARRPEEERRLREKLSLEPQEESEWLRAAENMYIPYDEGKKIYLQDDGFLDRVPWPLESIPRENFPLLLHYHPLVIYRHRVCKQADMVLAMMLLRDRFTLDEKRRCFEYYDPITTHDSSLSLATFSVLASEIGEQEKAYAYFHGTARLDLDDTHNNTKDGLHMANMAGTWMDLTSGFAGMYAGSNGLFFNPTLPQAIRRYAFTVSWRGRRIHVDVGQEGPKYTLLSGEPVDIVAGGRTLRLS